MKIFDFHVHIFPDELAKRAIPKLAQAACLTPLCDGTLSGTVSYMRESGIDGFLSLSVATNETQQANVNRFACHVEQSGINGVHAFGSFYPKAPDALDHLKNVHASGLRGVKLHPEYQAYDIDDRSVYPLYEACRDLGLIIVFHTGLDCAFPDSLRASVPQVMRVADEIKGFKMVAAHFGGYKHADEVAVTLAGKSDIYLDTSFSAGHLAPGIAQKIISRHGAERILFGSDCPWGSPRAHIEYIDRLKLTGRQKELIFAGNAMRLLGYC
ncbi:MAG: amidohydrolase family protein [Firmicutes bacterium]|nr:amidohydrolase family protein [Bacillota bacterium]